MAKTIVPGRHRPAEAVAGAEPGRRMPSTSVAFGAIFALFGLFLGAAPLSDNSLFTHIATGRLLWGGEFPRVDVYSFTASGEPWVIQSWLVSLGYGVLDAGVGPGAIRVAAALLTAALVALIWVLTRPAETLLSRSLITGFVLVVGAMAWTPRPLLVGFVLMAVALLVAEGRLAPPVLLPVFWVWANSHGSYPLGLVALACLYVGTRLDKAEADVERRAFLWAAGGTLASVIGPLGFSTLTFPIELLEKQGTLRYVKEWQSPAFELFQPRVFVLLVGVGVLALVRRPSYRSALPLIVFTAAALLAVRNMALAGLVFVPGLAHGLSGLGQLRGQERGKGVLIGLSALALLGGVVLQSRLSEPDYDLDGYPVVAVAWLDQQGLVPGDETRIVSPGLHGNYLELVYGGDAAVFIDDRVDMFPAPVVEDLVILNRGMQGWDEVLQRWGADFVLWTADEPLGELLSSDPAWRLVYQDGDDVVYCSRERPSGCARLAERPVP
jgi:hypothetical protein